MVLDTSSIDPLYEQANQASEQAVALTAAGGNLPQMLREAVNDRLKESPLFGQREEAAKQVLTSGTRGREQISNTISGGTILSPTQQQSILASQRASDVVPLLSLNDLLTNRIGGVDTAVNTGLNAFQSLLGSVQQTAQNKYQQAQDAFSRLLGLAQEDRAQQELELARQKSGSGSGSDNSILSQLLLASLGGGGGLGGGTQDYGEEPNYTPAANGETVVNDQGLVWQFQDTQWVPIGTA